MRNIINLLSATDNLVFFYQTMSILYYKTYWTIYLVGSEDKAYVHREVRWKGNRNELLVLFDSVNSVPFLS